jgi:hypothetical protein
MDDILGMLLDPTDLHLVGGALFAQTHLSVESNEALEAISMVALTAGEDPSCVMQPSPPSPSPAFPASRTQASVVTHSVSRQQAPTLYWMIVAPSPAQGRSAPNPPTRTQLDPTKSTNEKMSCCCVAEPLTFRSLRPLPAQVFCGVEQGKADVEPACSTERQLVSCAKSRVGAPPFPTPCPHSFTSFAVERCSDSMSTCPHTSDFDTHPASAAPRAF